MINRIKNSLRRVKQNAFSIPGWRTGRKLVLLESDDWGSIRMPSLEVYKDFITNGFDLVNSDYNRLDTLESNTDLEMLFEVLNSLKDSKDRSPVITANTIVGNPDFKRIKDSGFKEYYFEPVTETYKKYSNRDRVEGLIREGFAQGIYMPQFHGREHVNVIRWMNALQTGAKEIMFAFDKETTFSGKGDYNFMEVLDYNTPDDLVKMKESLIEGLDLFEKLFGFRSKSFIPPCYAWDSDIEEVLATHGVKYIQGLLTQMIPTGTFDQYKKKYHFLGSTNQHGQLYLSRNVFFEPALSKSTDHIGACMNRIKIAFDWKKPAVICSHRINFMGELDPENREQNLKLLKTLLQNIVKEWPEVEFISSDQLGDIILESKGK